MDMIAPVEAPAALLEPERVHVVAQPSIFREPSKRIVMDFPAGATLLDLVLETGMGEMGDDGLVQLPGNVVVEIEGHRIERSCWHVCRPNPGTLVNIYLMPGNQRQAILIGASLAIGVAAIATGGLAAGAGFPILGAIAASSIAIGGSYALREPWPAA